MSRLVRRGLLLLCLSILPLYGVWVFGQGVWIHAKAQLAQVLLESAWTHTLQGQKEVKPWPWADTWPVGRLTVPRLGQHRIVLAGANGASLAFGPGHLFNTGAPGGTGNCVIVGHRDTHFDFVRALVKGDRILLQTAGQRTISYEVVALMIVNEQARDVLAQDIDTTLTLITCYPFDAIRPGGPLRYIVIAKPVSESLLI
ncbi:MAG: class GN sortase [Thiotrichales bacterium]|nr:class GN sortase [Thiotrichales bacterium]